MQHHPKAGGETAPPNAKKKGKKTPEREEGGKHHHPKGRGRTATITQDEEEESCTIPKDAEKQHRPQGGRGEGESSISLQEDGRKVVLPSLHLFKK